MDIKYVVVFTVALYCGDCVKGNSLETSTNVSAIMAQQATLRCKYTSNKISDLYFIGWNKVVSDTEVVPIAKRRMPHTEQFLEDPKNSIRDFTNHVRLASNLSGNSVSLDLIIDGLKCADIGTYECQAMGEADTKMLTGVAELSIKVHPGTPTFKNEELQVTVNASFKLTCEAEVGTPPEVITFSYKPPGENKYTIIKEGIETEITPIPDRCTHKAVSSVAVTMSEEMDNGHYMCSVKEANLGMEGKPINFDEILLKVYRETTTVKTTEVAYTTPKKAEVSDNSAIAMSTSCASLLCGLLLAFLLTDRRTDS